LSAQRKSFDSYVFLKHIASNSSSEKVPN
ncbi:unnamed protein product, partial [Allacma fusca]